MIKKLFLSAAALMAMAGLAEAHTGHGAMGFTSVGDVLSWLMVGTCDGPPRDLSNSALGL